MLTNYAELDHTHLYNASYYGNLEVVNRCLNSGTNVNTVTKDGFSALHVAIQNEHFSVVKLLLEHKAQIDVQDKNGNTPLHHAVNAGALLIVEEVLKYHTDVNIKNHDDKTSLHIAVENKKLEEIHVAQVVKFLLECGALVDSQDKCGRTPLSIAAKRGSLEIVNELLKFSPDVNNKSNKSCIKDVVLNCMHSNLIIILLDYGLIVNPSDANNIALLHTAIEKGYVSIVNDLLMYGANFNSEHKNGFTPLHTAVKCNQEKIVNLLLKYGSNINAKCYVEKTPLFYAFEHDNNNIANILLTKGATVSDPEILINAVKQGSRESVAALLQHGADVNGKDANNRTPLHFCAFTWDNSHSNGGVEKPNPQIRGEIAELLLSKGAKVDARAHLIRGGHETPLHVACQSGYEEVVLVLLRYNANVNSKALQTMKFMTPLLFAVITGNTKIVTMLLNRGADIKCKAYPYKDAALHMACMHGHIDIVKLLLMSGAKVNARNHDGATPLHQASELGFHKIVEVLLQFRAKVNLRTYYGRSALDLAALSASYEVVAILCNSGADLKSHDGRHNTVLHFAADGGNVKALELLIKLSLEINARNHMELTPLHVAARRGHVTATVCLLRHGADINLASFNQTPLEYVMNGINPDNPTWHLLQEVSEKLTRHIVKLKASGLEVADQNLRAIASRENTKQLYDQCEKEMVDSKSQTIGNTVITFYDIMTKDTKAITQYLRNSSIVQEFTSSEYKIKFSEYASELEELFRKGWKRKSLLDEGQKFFILLKSVVLPEDCVEQILNYLENRDLKSLKSLLC